MMDGERARTSAIRGLVVKMGERPVEVAPLERSDMPSPPATPVEAEVRATDIRTLAVVATVRSTAEGRFLIDAPAGAYELQAYEGGEAAGPPLYVDTARGPLVDVTVYLDTGVR